MTLPDASDLTDALNASRAERKHRPGGKRFYGSIGASTIGKECDALLSLTLRGFPENDVGPKLSRIFMLGHAVEELVVADLQSIGLEIIFRDEVTNRQITFNSHGGHVISKVDGLIVWPDGMAEIAEIKSMNEKKFKEFVAHTLAKSHPHYIDQCVMMMGQSGTRSAVVIGYNKNNCEYHVERVPFDEERWAYLRARLDIAMTGEARRVSNDPKDFRCGGCFKADICHSGWQSAWGLPECSHCSHAWPDIDRRWWCRLHERFATDLCLDFDLYEPKPA